MSPASSNLQPSTALAHGSSMWNATSQTSHSCKSERPSPPWSPQEAHSLAIRELAPVILCTEQTLVRVRVSDRVPAGIDEA
eukprot:4261354-Prymnesium_polylepis.1